MKRLISVLLLIVTVFSVMIIPVNAANIYNTMPSYCYEAADFLYRHGIMLGVSDTNFGADISATRGQIVTLLWRIKDKPGPSGSTVRFSDCTKTTAYYYDAVKWGSSKNVEIVKGYTDGTFLPNKEVTYQEALTFLYRFAKYYGYAPDTDTGYKYTLSCYSVYNGKFSGFATAAAGWAIRNGLISTEKNKTISPTASCRRGDVANYIYKAFYKGEMHANIAASPATCNSSNGSLPNSVKNVKAGAGYYFNFQVPDTLKVKTAKLYITEKARQRSSYAQEQRIII